MVKNPPNLLSKVKNPFLDFRLEEWQYKKKKSYLKSFPHHLPGNYLVLVWIVSICLCKVLWTTFLITSILKLVCFLKVVLIFVKSYSSELKSLQKSVFYWPVLQKWGHANIQVYSTCTLLHIRALHIDYLDKHKTSNKACVLSCRSW